jgi:hypothetical protein
MAWGALFLFLLAGDVTALNQDAQKPAENEVKLEFFSGTVTEFSATRVTVLREVIDRDPEERTFVINADTKIEGTLRGKVRVTVGYFVEEEAHIAVRIIVRTDAK